MPPLFCIMGNPEHDACSNSEAEAQHREKSRLKTGRPLAVSYPLLPGQAECKSSKSLNRSLRSLGTVSIKSGLLASVQHLADAAPPEHTLEDRSSGTLPPDGGYGWVVVAAAFCSSWLIGSMFAAFSILYIEWTHYYGSDKWITGWVGSVYLAIGNFLSFAFSVLVKRWGCRTVSLLGAVVSAVGFFASAFAPTLAFLYISYGIVAGIGTGLLFLSTTVIVQEYFTSRRAVAAGIASSGLSMGTVTAGPITQLLIDHYGWRGTMVIWAGAYLHCAVFGALYRPLVPSRGRRKNCDPNSVTPPVRKSSVKHVCDMSVLRNPMFVLYCLGTLVANLGVIPFYTHTPGRALFMGVDKRKVSFLPTVIGTSTAISRIVFGFVANMKCVNRLLQYAVAVLLGGCFITSYSLATTFPMFVFYCAVNGTINGIWLTVQTTILADLMDISMIAFSQSFICLANGVASLLSIPFAGFLFDISGNYDMPFYVCGSLQAFGGLMLLCVPILHWRKGRSYNGSNCKGEV